jgi:PRTRC genetic system protein E
VEKDKEFIEELQKPVPPAEDIDDVNVEEDDVEDLQGEVVDATTIRTEAPKSNLQKIHKGTIEEHDEAVRDEFKKIHENRKSQEKAVEDKLTTGNTGGFFSSLSKLGFQQLNLSVNRLEDDKLNVIVKPQNFSGDPAFDEIRPLNITGTAQELEEGFFEAVGRPLQKVAGMMTNAKTFLDDLAEQEKKTKAAEAKQKKVKDLVDKAKKYHDDKDFDPSKTVSFNTATKKWQAVLELDPENKDAKEGMEKLKEYKAKNGETLDL